MQLKRATYRQITVGPSRQFMVIPSELGKKFCEIVEFSNVPWSLVDEVAVSDPNILRPIKGVCFEEMFRIIASKYMSNSRFSLGPGDSDVDINLEKHRLQLKTTDKNSTTENKTIGVALHKTHGREERPYNLYSTKEPTFDFLVTLHPTDGILIVPYAEIPTNPKWLGYLADPAQFEWNSGWRNQWDLLGYSELRGKSLESRVIPTKSQLPKLSSETYLEDYQIIQALCRPEYFRAAVMGLKGNIKEFWLIDLLRKHGHTVSTPTESYPKYDCTVTNNNGRKFKIQIKGTSKNMCDPSNETIGLEVMGTHGQFPERGYKQSFFDYLAVVISEDQVNKRYSIPQSLHFIFMPVSDLPLHYLIGKGISTKDTGYRNKRWNKPEFADVLYPNIKLKTKYNKALMRVEISPYIAAYRKQTGFDVIGRNSRFRSAGPYILDEVPNILK